MEENKLFSPSELSDDEEEDKYEDEEDEEYEEDEEDLKAFTEALEKALPFERWLELSAERDRCATENQAGEPGDRALNS